MGKEAFELLRKVENLSFLEGNCNIEWDRLINKYALHTVLYILKLKSKFHNSKLELIEKSPDEWISNLEGLQKLVNEFGLKGSMNDKDFMIHVLYNFPKEYDVILNGLEKSQR